MLVAGEETKNMTTRQECLLRESKLFKGVAIHNQYFSDIDIVDSIIGENEKYLFGCYPSEYESPYEFEELDLAKSIHIQGEAFLILFTSINAAHGMSELVHQVSQYFKYGLEMTACKIYVSHVVSRMPLIKTILLQIFGHTEIIFLNSDQDYIFESVFIGRSEWFATAILSENHVYEDGDVTILDARFTDFSATSGVEFFKQFVKKIFEFNKHRYSLHENICIIKSNLNDNNTTPLRQIEIDKELVEHIEKNNYKFIAVCSTSDFLEIICQIFAAKNIITSYGGANCVNRFFFNENAIIKEIANIAYCEEYGELRHIICTSTKVSRYYVFKDVENQITLDSLSFILGYNYDIDSGISLGALKAIESN